jgi:hypothetical protein
MDDGIISASGTFSTKSPVSLTISWEKQPGEMDTPSKGGQVLIQESQLTAIMLTRASLRQERIMTGPPLTRRFAFSGSMLSMFFPILLGAFGGRSRPATQVKPNGPCLSNA